MQDVTLYLGDCLDVMRGLADGCVDAVVTDPPYSGMSGGVDNAHPGVAGRARVTMTIGQPWGSDLSPLKEFQRVARYGAIVFCSWHCISEVKDLIGGKPVALLTWFKRNSQPTARNRPWYRTEFAWAVEYAPGMNWKVLDTLYDIPGLAAGCMATERILMEDSGQAAHPTQKPLQLIGELVSACGMSVIDPYMGSGTTGVACVRTGRRFIGIELDPTYYAIAERRIAAAQLQAPLFPHESEAVTQMSLDV